MTKKIVASVITLMLAMALPISSAFAVQSSNANSPNVNSPSVNSPNVNSPNVDSPNVDSPNVDSPNVDSPNVDSPNVDFPAVNASNVSANSINGAASANSTSTISAEGTLVAPHSGAFNLLVIGGGTVALFAAAGVAAWVLLRKLQ